MRRHGVSRYPALSLVVALSALAAAGAAAQTAGAHVHGVSTLLVAVEAGDLILELTTPGDDVVGFEHRPADAAQTRRAESALALMKSPERLFRFDAAAGCEPGVVAVLRSLLPSGHGDGERSHATGSGHRDETEHAEFRLRYSYRCRAVDGLKTLELLLFDHFPGMRRVRVQIVGPQGQTSHRLDRGSRKAAF
ncbi:MAG: DUF2796 domain-containing protein [Alphaproteobacteria bacterium]|jgi:hypothetical protein|nr:DUF2796 domain-containing protein [Alphaproteobacteria bacterium]MDP6815495.1 DUF2796 domain-containing protein [Alphaproteobacteria bacterium]